MLSFPIIFNMFLFFIIDFGIFKVFIKYLYKSKLSSLMIWLALKKLLAIAIIFLSAFGGEIILPSSSIIFQKYFKSRLTLPNLKLLEKCNINLSVMEGCGSLLVLLSLLFILILF